MIIFKKCSILFCLTSVLYAGNCIFEKEKVTAFICHPDTLEIKGIYWFLNNSKITETLPIYFPFAIDSLSAYPDYIKLTSSGRPVMYNKMPEGIMWQMEIPGGQRDSISLVYRQFVKKQQGTYIVMTAKDWNRPLDRAEFKVVLPQTCKLLYCSFNTDSLTISEAMVNYHFVFTPFSPVTDLFLNWSCRE